MPARRDPPLELSRQPFGAVVIHEPLGFHGTSFGPRAFVGSLHRPVGFIAVRKPGGGAGRSPIRGAAFSSCLVAEKR
jgi:hypothetical protein